MALSKQQLCAVMKRTRLSLEEINIIQMKIQKEVVGRRATRNFSINVPSKIQEKKCPAGKILKFFLLDTLKTTF